MRQILLFFFFFFFLLIFFFCLVELYTVLDKKTVKKNQPFFIIATNLNETLMA